jgi:hypothetical protein
MRDPTIFGDWTLIPLEYFSTFAPLVCLALKAFANKVA